jgi:prepilin-type N-terminal cleavage/methylation domain-containing protein
MIKKTKGFTLIELLVVIAIIGILSSVVLASLNSARNKGADAAVKSNLSGIRAQAELVYDSATPNSYDGVCENSNVIAAMASAANAGGSAGTCRDYTTATAKDSWAITIPLKQGGSYCVDYKGTATTSASTLTVGSGTAEAVCQ